MCFEILSHVHKSLEVKDVLFLAIKAFKFVFCNYSPTRKPSIKEAPPQDDHDEDLDRMLNDFQQQRAAKALQRQWRGYQGRKKLQTEEQERQAQNQAASTLQKNWRRHRERVSRFNERSTVKVTLLVLILYFSAKLVRKWH